ncbi:uncharacterized protein FOMMEDRAFT_24933 [Fomitiporia mediterranea MF3/22]|uniref:uncharacterized protein n=1 Tax=Fomitiporia mediterranea (strain MF3/22) TaxID=694068 RepID=UPI0004407525|nr:uncharacterized protein FOMMEDRAFT_24933 [Fomitiporia mediterranea MF3/22]EJD07609.1 hypothetical protein FOMMEDRAFT_24933 [Fomitiporia mediterranea MF3/22]
MPVNRVAEQVFGTMGTVCWSGQIIPQIWKSWREKATEGLSHWLMLIWAIAAVFLGVFVILQDLNIPLIIQPQIFGLLSLISWSQCLYYEHKKPYRQVILILTMTLAILGGFEAGMVFAVRPAVNKGNDRPVTFFGVMASITLAVGLLPQYGEIIRFREVKGISMFFMAIDTLGGVFSLLSLVFREKFDALAAVAYSLVVLLMISVFEVLDGVVIILAVILNPRAERRRRRVAQENADGESQVGTTINDAVGNRGEKDGDPTLVTSRDASTEPSTPRRMSLVTSEKRTDIERAEAFVADSEKNGQRDN